VLAEGMVLPQDVTGRYIIDRNFDHSCLAGNKVYQESSI
jgi:hypothetical protein